MIKLIWWIFVGALVAGLAMVTFSLHTFGWVNELVKEYGYDTLGADPRVSFLVALALFALIALLPWKSVLFAPLTGNRKGLLILMVVALALAGLLKVIGQRSWIETLDGPVIIYAPPGSMDRATGLVSRPLDADVLRAIRIWRTVPRNVGAGNKYFSQYDGKPKTWFVSGTCESRPADGYDDRGRKLEPATSEKVEACEAQRVAAEKKAAQSDATARRAKFERVGVYRMAGRWVMVDSIVYVLEEVVVLRESLRLKFRIRNTEDAETVPSAREALRIGIVTAHGELISATSVRRIEGAVEHDQGGRAFPPAPGQAGSIDVELRRRPESGAFLIVINDATAFSRVSTHIRSFRGL
jgi:hypothetical protein